MPPLEETAIVDLVDCSSISGRETLAEPSSHPLRFFGFVDDPFSDSVNPQFFYRTDAHEAAFVAMKRCIEDNISLGLTTAVSGTGKTLLTQVLLQELDPERYRPALVLIYPKMSPAALLREICGELGVRIAGKRPTMHELVAAIHQETMALYLKGIKLVLIIDEVHFLTAASLQMLRTLSNIEIPQKKLVTILLFGEDSFLKKLGEPTFKSILSRMYTRVRLRPLTVEEVEQYVKFRLLLVNGRPSVFHAECFGWLREKTEGIPREINRICHNALQRAALARKPTITRALLEEVE